MKISLNWIFDHIEGELSGINVSELVDAFIKKTAEIEGWRKVSVDTNQLTLVEVIGITNDAVAVYSSEHKKEYILPQRPDAALHAWFMINIAKSTPSWATSLVFGGIKEMVL